MNTLINYIKIFFGILEYTFSIEKQQVNVTPQKVDISALLMKY